MTATADVGIIGGSGFYELLTDAEEHDLDTPYGRPSDRVAVGQFAGRSVAFLPRHGRGHRIPPHRINYRANVWALGHLGVTRLVAPCAVGSLTAALTPGTFVVLDQFVDRTRGRADTFYDGAAVDGDVASSSSAGDPPSSAAVLHVSMAEPYCPELRVVAAGQAAGLGLPYEPAGTIVVIQGPRFSTRAESRWFAAVGWDVVGMTQYPEVVLAREQAMCVLGIAMVTDHDAGLDDHPETTPVTSQAVLEVMAANVDHLQRLLAEVVTRIPTQRDCPCGQALDQARA